MPHFNRLSSSISFLFTFDFHQLEVEVRSVFPLKQMLSFLSQAVERLFQVVQTIYIPLE